MAYQPALEGGLAQEEPRPRHRTAEHARAGRPMAVAAAAAVARDAAGRSMRSWETGDDVGGKGGPGQLWRGSGQQGHRGVCGLGEHHLHTELVSCHDPRVFVWDRVGDWVSLCVLVATVVARDA